MNIQTQNHGFLPDKIASEDYIFGGKQITDFPMNADGQWDEYLPENELQSKNNLETMNCTAYGTLNCIEILLNAKYNIKENFSERYIGVLAETLPQGNSPHKIAETIRKISGLIKESLLPFNDGINTWEGYYNPNPMTSFLQKEGQKFLEQFEFKHEWVTSNENELKKALKLSPLGVSVHAWIKEGNYYVKPQGYYPNHWCMLYGYEEGKFWKIFDFLGV